MSNIEITISEEPITVTVEGGIGPAGPPGSQGPPGSPGVDGGESATIVFQQQVASNHWVITHAWPGGFPSVTIADTSGSVVLGEVIYTSGTQIDLFFSAVFSGYAYLN